MMLLLGDCMKQKSHSRKKPKTKSLRVPREQKNEVLVLMKKSGEFRDFLLTLLPPEPIVVGSEKNLADRRNPVYS